MPGLTRTQRVVALALFAVVTVLLVVTPVLVLVVAAFARSWTAVLPTSWTTSHLQEAVTGDGLASLGVSLQTALVASLVASALGTWAALAARHLSRRGQAAVGAIMHLPAAVPSVVVGLGVLVAFSGPPLMLGGTPRVVIIAQTTLVLSFAYSSVAGAAARMDARLSQVAASLGASSRDILLRVELPMLLPAIGASVGLALALAMGELGATIMVYPPSWRTLPVTIFTASDRGALFTAAADTLVLVSVTVVVLALVGRLASGSPVALRRRPAAASPRSVQVEDQVMGAVGVDPQVDATGQPLEAAGARPGHDRA